MMHKTKTTYTLPASDLNALILATQETLDIARAEFDRLRRVLDATESRREEDAYAWQEMERVRRVIDNAVHTLNTIRELQDRQREAVA